MLSEPRQEIDKIDAEIIALLERRYDQVSRVLALKKANNLAVLDSNREAQQIEAITKVIKNPEYIEPISATFEAILKTSRDYQARQL